MAATGSTSCRRSSATTSTPTAYLDWATRWASSAPSRSSSSSIRAAAEIPPRGAGPRRGPAAPTHRERIETYFDPLPFWYPPFEAAIDSEGFPLHAITQRPMRCIIPGASQNAWLRQILGSNRLYINRAARDALGLADGDWVWIESHRPRQGAGQADGRRQPDTVWTWNAIGKRAGAWASRRRAGIQKRGFLLNHLIRLAARSARAATASPMPIRSPARRPGTICACASRRRAEAEPQRAAAFPSSAPESPALRRAFAGERRKGGRAMTACRRARPEEARPGHRSRHLRRLPGLRHRLQGMEHRRLLAPLTDQDAYGATLGRLAQPRPFLRVGREGAASRTVHFPRSCLHCETPACVTVCPTGASYKRAEDGIVLVNPETCIGCKLCSWACPYGAREYRLR
jgi:ferredoxin